MPENHKDRQPYVLFELAGTTYGLLSGDVQQMEMIEQVTPVPRAPAFVEGMVFLRGSVVPVIDLRARFGFEKAPYTLRSRLIVISTAGRSVGLAVDSAREFVSIPRDAVQPPPEAIAGLSGQYLRGIVSLEGRLILILNAEAIVNAPENATFLVPQGEAAAAEGPALPES